MVLLKWFLVYKIVPLKINCNALRKYYEQSNQNYSKVQKIGFAVLIYKTADVLIFSKTRTTAHGLVALLLCMLLAAYTEKTQNSKQKPLGNPYDVLGNGR